MTSQHWSVVPEARAALRDAFGENLEWIGNTRAVSVGRTFLQADPGHVVHVPGKNGELGAAVFWGAEKGYLTAGHVGQSVNAQADDGHGRNIATVVYVRTANAVQPQGCAGSSVDVAVVKLNPGVRHGTLGVVATAVPSPRDKVEVHTRKGVQSARIYGATRWWYVSSSGVTLTEIYLSDTGVTQPGDSGGPVLLKGVKGQIIGHIVAGGTSTSCFQDIGHQLSEIRKDPNFQAIRI